MPLASSARVFETWSATLTLPLSPMTPDDPPDWARLTDETFSVARTVSPPSAPVWTRALPSTRAAVVLLIACVRNDPPTPTVPAWLPNGETGLLSALADCWENRLSWVGSSSSLMTPARLSSVMLVSAVTLTLCPADRRLSLTRAPAATVASDTLVYRVVPTEPVTETVAGVLPSAVLDDCAQTLKIWSRPPRPFRAVPISPIQLPLSGSSMLKRSGLKGRNLMRSG